MSKYSKYQDDEESEGTNEEESDDDKSTSTITEESETEEDPGSEAGESGDEEDKEEGLYSNENSYESSQDLDDDPYGGAQEQDNRKKTK